MIAVFVLVIGDPPIWHVYLHEKAEMDGNIRDLEKYSARRAIGSVEFGVFGGFGRHNVVIFRLN